MKTDNCFSKQPNTISIYIKASDWNDRLLCCTLWLAHLPRPPAPIGLAPIAPPPLAPIGAVSHTLLVHNSCTGPLVIIKGIQLKL